MRPTLALLLVALAGCSSATPANPTDAGTDVAVDTAPAVDVGCPADAAAGCPACPVGYAIASVCDRGMLSCGCGMLPTDAGVDATGLTDALPDVSTTDGGSDVLADTGPTCVAPSVPADGGGCFCPSNGVINDCGGTIGCVDLHSDTNCGGCGANCASASLHCRMATPTWHCAP